MMVCGFQYSLQPYSRIIPEISHGHCRILSPIIAVDAHYAGNSHGKACGTSSKYLNYFFLKFKTNLSKRSVNLMKRLFSGFLVITDRQTDRWTDGRTDTTKIISKKKEFLVAKVQKIIGCVIIVLLVIIIIIIIIIIM